MKLTTENYYSKEAHKAYMSVSQFKDWQECEHRAYAKYITGDYIEPDKDCYLAGNYVGTQFESKEAHDEFLERNRDKLFAKRGDGILKKYSYLDALYERAKQDKFFMMYMTGEHEVVITFELFGVTWKARIDCINHDLRAITDLKTCKDFGTLWDAEQRVKVPFYDYYNYYLQLAVYQEAYRLTTGKKYGVYIAAVTKQSPPDIDLISFNEARANQRLAHELTVIESYLPEIMAIKSGKQEPGRCGKCDYCIETKQITEFTIAKGWETE